MKSVLILLITLITSVVLSGAVAAQAQQARAVSSSGSGAAGSQLALSQKNNGAYIMGPEDLLSINVWKEPELSLTVPVRPDGMITLPLLGDVKASGLTPLELRAKLIGELRAYISNPEVAVIVREINSRKFNIVGEVARPGSYSLAGQVSVLDAIAIAGGFREFAKTKKVYVLRRLPDGSHARMRFNYRGVVKGKKLSQNVELKAGDTVVVP